MEIHNCRRIDIVTALILVFILGGCASVKETGLYATDVVTTPAALLDPNLYQSEWPEAYEKASNAPPEEWEIIKVGKWKRDRYKDQERECRDVKKRHIPTGIVQYSGECRPLQTMVGDKQIEKTSATTKIH